MHEYLLHNIKFTIMIKFGKFKGESFETVLKLDKGYCRWVLSLNDPNPNMKEFQQFIKKNAVNQISGRVSLLASNIVLDETFKKFTMKLNVSYKQLGEPHSYPKWIEDRKAHSYYGIFLDYMIRHYILTKRQMSVTDTKSLIVLNDIFSHIMHDFCVFEKYYGEKFLLQTSRKRDLNDEFQDRENKHRLTTKYNPIFNYLTDIISDPELDIQIVKLIIYYISSDREPVYANEFIYKHILLIRNSEDFNSEVKISIDAIRNYLITQYYLCKIQRKSKIMPGTFNIDDKFTIDKVLPLGASYLSFVHNSETLEIIEDVFNTSLMHSIFFRHTDSLNFINIEQKKITKILYEDIINWITSWLNGAKNVMVNPSVGNTEMKMIGDPDLIIDDNLIDFKVSKQITGTSICDFYQLIIYAALYEKNTGIRINNLVIYNPLGNYQACVDIRDWDYNCEFMPYLMSKLRDNE